ncbi:hypothetical protein COW81_03205 [Candidatus Campbellbacteria bacterium CG22_combo_CG10-13_8_21_14_all_36_13]|uniref:Uncharacterized protein n=1 Tax=Candidatus Campbellbacteria bacterium CG22_combo_CG10-13_8_21_14_all_36_13 TaxID=1974529 RepID=A0A2H0DY20_9BACT|nr:MAG: hypothetical protein COW81_03205 [Candidatus Campbellbacteria bacterium CG22_combo_CG10-13_8_21_14_all_36_13]
MSVQFEQPKYTPQYSFDKPPTGFVGLLIKWGVAKDKRGAQKILLIVLCITVLITFFVIFSDSGQPKDDTLPEDDPLILMSS